MKTSRKDAKSQRVYFFLIPIVMFITTGVEGFSQVITLDTILNRIERNHPALKSFTEKINSANELVKGAKALPAPQAGLEFDDNSYRFRFNENVIRIGISQQFINGKSLKAKENYLKSLADLDVKDSEKLKNELFYQAKQKYFERYISDRKIGIITINIDLLKTMISISEKQLSISSNSDMSSIYRLKARLANTETELIHEQNEIKKTNVFLNYMMSEDLNESVSIDTTYPVKKYIGTPSLKDTVASRRSDVMKMNSEINSMKLNKELILLQSKPEFGFRFRNYLRFPKETTTSMNMGTPTPSIPAERNMFSVEGMVSIPIAPWYSKGYKAEARAMGFSILAKEDDRIAMINMATQTIKMLLVELNSEYLETENYSENVLPAYRKSLEVNLLSYRQNTNELNMVLLAWDDIQMAEQAYLVHLSTLLQLQAEYEKEMQIK